MATVKDRTLRRKASVRRTVKAAASGRKRLSVHRSGKHIYAQVIDDASGTTVQEIMTPDVLYVEAGQSVEECMALMIDKNIRLLVGHPVIAYTICAAPCGVCTTSRWNWVA